MGMDRIRTVHLIAGAAAGVFISSVLWSFGVPLKSGFASRSLFFLAGAGGGLFLAGVIVLVEFLFSLGGKFIALPRSLSFTLRLAPLLLYPLAAAVFVLLFIPPLNVYGRADGVWLRAGSCLLFAVIAGGAAALVFLPRPRPRLRAAAGMVFLLAVLSWFCFSERRPESSRGVVLVTIDTLRSDYLGCYGHEGGVSPFLDRMAEKGVRFRQAYATAPVTGPSHVAMLTGLYPRRSGVIFNGYPASYPEIDSIGRVFADQGYNTAAITSRVRLNPAELKVPGFQYISCPEVRALDTPASEATRRAGLYIRSHRHETFFLWVHYWDPHSPYFPPPEHRNRFAPGVQGRGEPPVWLEEKNMLSEDELTKYRSLYEGEVFYTDRSIKRLYDFTGDCLGDASSLTWIFVADHGETLGEIQDKYAYGFGHVDFIYEENLMVPWIMYGRGMPQGISVLPRVSTVDLAPTLLDLLGMPGLRKQDGESLAPLFKPGTSGREKPVFFERWIPEGGPIPQTKEPLHGMIADDIKWIGNRSGHQELYDLSADPEERHDLCDKRPGLAEKMKSKWERWDEQNPETSPDADEKLPVSVQDFRALGYFK